MGTRPMTPVAIPTADAGSIEISPRQAGKEVNNEKKAVKKTLSGHDLLAEA